MLNRIKEELLVPDCLRLSNVSTIYKGKGSKRDVLNLRGIFKLPIVRNILDKLIYMEDKSQINKSMGPFQVGNQSERNIRDHTLIIHAIVNEARQNKKMVDILFTDIKQCFDSVWLEEALNDLYCSGITSRNLNLLFEGNKETDMCVETKYGQSQRVKLKKIVMQGSVSGGTLCSNQISKFCNQTYQEGNIYMYDNAVPVPALAMVDDIASAVVCNSVNGIRCNVCTDEFVKSKKLESQVGEGKCQWVHVGKGECRSKYQANGSDISQCNTYKYLGDHVADGWDSLYSKRYEKALSSAISCQAMCTEISLGHHMYSTMKLLHQAIFLNGTLVNMETWPHCSEGRVALFERAEQSLFRKVLSAHSKTPVECLYLELGIVPFRFHLMKKRIMYYQTIMKRDENEITRLVVCRQKERKLKGDFYPQVLEDMNYLNINEDDISGSKDVLKAKIEKAVDTNALKFLLQKAESHSKVRSSLYSDLKGMEYMEDQRFHPEVVNMLFQFRTRMYNVKNNFRSNYKQSNILCPLCKKEEDTQEHMFTCQVINSNCEEKQCQENQAIGYEDIFTKDLNQLLKAAHLLQALVKTRAELEEEMLSNDAEH